MNLSRWIIGEPLPKSSLEHSTLPKVQALPILASDALSSVAYATEAMLGVLILAGSSALKLSEPITICIILLVAIVVLSYRQVITAYPDGGGSYVVCRENLGRNLGLLAAASLLVDYSLTAAVSLMAGCQAISSLFPWFLSHEVSLALIMLILVGWANLRGVKEAGQIFALPTYSFVIMVGLLMIGGMQDIVFHHGFTPDKPSTIITGIAPLGLFLVLRAFSSGCSALTGIEAISNGTKLFKEPHAENAKQTLLVLGIVLSILFLGVSSLAYLYGIVPNNDVTVLAQIGERVFGTNSLLLWLLQISTLLILVLAANTAFTGFPRLAALLAEDYCLPTQMKWLGDRLVYQNGIVFLIGLTGFIIVLCQGSTAVAVNLYALGVFTAFTLSQLGLVKRWHELKGKGWVGRLGMNAAGASCTFVVLIVIILSKFREGAWSIIVIVPLICMFLDYVRKRYRFIRSEIALSQFEELHAPLLSDSNASNKLAIVYLPEINRPAIEALSYALQTSSAVKAVTVAEDDQGRSAVAQKWAELTGAKQCPVQLEILTSSYSSYINPLVDYISKEEDQNPEMLLDIVMPVAITEKPFDYFLLNQRMAYVFKALKSRKNCTFSAVRYRITAPTKTD